MIGLKRHTVRLVTHQPEWAALAADACRRIRAVCGGCIVDVQHVGSTSVPGLIAKPILDLAAAVNGPEVMPELIGRLTAAGFIYRGDGGDEGGHLFVREPEPDVRTIHLHVVSSDDIQWAQYLVFRDLLRQDAALRERYAALKQELRATFADDRKAYTDGKHDFIRGILQMDQARSAHGDAQ